MNRKEHLAITILETSPGHFLIQSVAFGYKNVGHIPFCNYQLLHMNLKS